MEPYDPRKLPDMPEMMIAGPGELHEEDLDVLGHQVIAHYGDIWTALHQDCITALGELLGAEDPPYLIPGTGTLCLDAAVGNLFEPGQRVVVANTGFFGVRLMEVAAAHKLEIVEVEVDAGAPIDAQAIGEAAKGADGVLTVHVETATGVRHPIADIAAATHAAGAVYVVDGIASAGGELCDVDAMEIDCLVTGSQKGLEAPPGLGILALGVGGRERLEARGSRPNSFYLDLKRWDWYRREWGSWHPHPVTMPTNIVLALYSSIRRITESGIEDWVQRRAALAERCRHGLMELGFDSVAHPGCGANLVVAMWADEPLPLVGHLLKQHSIMISGGLPPLQGKSIRVGLMGRTATDEMVDRVLTGIAEVVAP
jgi:alanine-glyoxylate transaminase / serine-glyoxylate transaminase / serine-pyruvate transaminase